MSLELRMGPKKDPTISPSRLMREASILHNKKPNKLKAHKTSSPIKLRQSPNLSFSEAFAVISGIFLFV